MLCYNSHQHCTEEEVDVSERRALQSNKLGSRQIAATYVACVSTGCSCLSACVCLSVVVVGTNVVRPCLLHFWVLDTHTRAHSNIDTQTLSLLV